MHCAQIEALEAEIETWKQRVDEAVNATAALQPVITGHLSTIAKLEASAVALQKDKMSALEEAAKYSRQFMDASRKATTADIHADKHQEVASTYRVPLTHSHTLSASRAHVPVSLECW